MNIITMQAKLSKPIWIGTCPICKSNISFSPEKPIIQDEHEYTCYCGKKYWIDRNTGYYNKLGKVDENS